MVKLINFIRAEVIAGNGLPDLTTTTAFQGDHFLRPVLEDDPLLYSLHDIIGDELDKEVNGLSMGMEDAMSQQGSHDTDRVTYLEEKLRHAQQEIEARRQELQALKLQFGLLGSPETSLDGSQNGALYCGNEPSNDAAESGNTDSSYFASYSGHGKFAKQYEKMQI